MGDALGMLVEGVLSLFARSCGVMSRRVTKGQSITLFAVGLVLAVATPFAMDRAGTAALLLPFGGTLLAGMAGGVPSPYPLTAGFVASCVGLLVALPVALLQTF